jgi:hypothetical protein
MIASRSPPACPSLGRPSCRSPVSPSPGGLSGRHVARWRRPVHCTRGGPRGVAFSAGSARKGELSECGQVLHCSATRTIALVADLSARPRSRPLADSSDAACSYVTRARRQRCDAGCTRQDATTANRSSSGRSSSCAGGARSGSGCVEIY